MTRGHLPSCEHVTDGRTFKPIFQCTKDHRTLQEKLEDVIANKGTSEGERVNARAHLARLTAKAATPELQPYQREMIDNLLSHKKPLSREDILSAPNDIYEEVSRRYGVSEEDLRAATGYANAEELRRGRRAAAHERKQPGRRFSNGQRTDMPHGTAPRYQDGQRVRSTGSIHNSEEAWEAFRRASEHAKDSTKEFGKRIIFDSDEAIKNDDTVYVTFEFDPESKTHKVKDMKFKKVEVDGA